MPTFVVTHEARPDLHGADGGTFAGEKAELSAVADPVAGAVTHLRHPVRKP